MATVPGAPQPSTGTIEIRVRSLTDLFNPLDPLPLRERALDHGVESYILSRVGELPAREPLRLFIHCPESLEPRVDEIAQGIHEHFRRMHARSEWQFRRRIRIGGITLGIGLTVLGTSLGLRSLLGDLERRGLVGGLGEGLLILGWVAMWRPVEILLYEHWESHLNHAVLDRLSRIQVELRCLPDSAGRASTDQPADRLAARAVEEPA